MNCRKVRREIEEATPGKWLSSEVNNHVSSCGACETLLREQTRLRELVASLGTVTAPDDFDFRLRARLAAEKRAETNYFAFGNFSFGLRSVAAVTMLLLVGSVLMFVSFRSHSNDPLSSGVANNVPSKGADTAVAPAVVKTAPPQVAGGQDKQAVDGRELLTPKRRHGLRQTELASHRDSSQGTRELSSTSAAVLKRDQLAGVYSAPAFPIDAGYESLKVSVDDGRGTSRTISLPKVSFGSQRSLSQSPTPLMASARGAW
jgi:hypothetical protein